MRFATCTVFVTALLMMLAACESTRRHEAVAAGPAKTAQAAKVACARCVYHMASVGHCQPAVRIGDKTYLLSGVDVDLHEYELCKAARPAKLVGEVEGDTFVASRVEIEP